MSESAPEPTYMTAFPPLVHVALGVLMASLAITAQDALARLLFSALQRNASVEEIAQLLVDRPDRAEELMNAN